MLFRSKKCQYKYIEIHKKQTNKEKYNVENVFQIEKIKEKSKITWMKNYGYEYAQQSNIVREKCKQTCLERYNVEYCQQNKEIHEKGQRTRFELKQFRDTDIWCQGSYELDFLEKYYSTEIQRGPSIEYKYEDKNKIYFPDFYIPSLNLIIEIKNSYLAKKDKEIITAKEKATIANGFNYIIIIEKDYKDFLYFMSK